MKFSSVTVIAQLTHLKHSAKFVQTFNTTALQKAAEAQKVHHAHMHTREDSEEVEIVVKTAQDLEASFTWTPRPPSHSQVQDADDFLAGIECVSADDVVVEFAVLED